MQTVSEEKRKDISEREVRSENPRLLADDSRGIAKTNEISDLIAVDWRALWIYPDFYVGPVDESDLSIAGVHAQ